MEARRVCEVVGADIAIVSLVSAAGEVALSMVVAQPELKESYIKFSTARSSR